MRVPVDLVGGFYTDDSLPWSCQDTVNYIPVAAEASGTRTVSKLVDAPGLRPFVWIGHTEEGTLSAPIRGMHDVEGRLFVVCGRTLYEISNKGVAIPRGAIPGVGRVSMAHNQRSGGNELIVVNGSAGFVWNTGTEQFSIITDAGYPGAAVVEFIDGYLMQVEPFGRFLFHSDLADALEYNTLDRFEAETAPDRTLGMIVNHQEVWAFGERTVDVFGNAGTAQGTFQNKGVSISRGCAAKWSPAVIDNGVAWLGDDLKVYHATGYSPIRISTRAIESALSECSRNDLRNAFAFVWEDLSHAVYYLTVPNGPTFGYDFSTGLWHRRASWHPERDLSGRWRVNDLVKHNGRWIAGDYQTGKLYVLDWDYMQEGCEPLVRERVSPVAHNDARGFVLDSAEVLFDTGGQGTECIPFPAQPQGPSIEGEAPDAMNGDPYTFTYTVTPGDAPILRTVLLDTPLPDGWVWDEATATISHDDTPIPTGTISLQMRVIDANGLWADHSDEFLIAAENFLLVVGSPNNTGEPMFATSRALEPLSFTGIPQAGGADLAAGSPIFYDGHWIVIGEDDYRYSDDLETWLTADSGVDNPCPHIAAGPEGWLAGRYATTGSANISRLAAEDYPGNFTTVTWSVDGNHVGAINMARYVEPYYYADLAGIFMRSEDMATWGYVVSNRLGMKIVRVWDVCEFHGELYITCRRYVGTIPGQEPRYQLRKWDEDTQNFTTVLIDVESTETGTLRPWQMDASEDRLLVLGWGCARVYTSEDGFAEPHLTGIQSTRASPNIEAEAKGRMIVYSAGRFFIVSGNYSDGAQANKCVSTVDGITFTEPASVGISNITGIAATRF